MWRKGANWLIILLLFSLSGCAYQSVSPVTPPPQKISVLDHLKQVERQQGEIHYLVLGDSVALGKGSSPGKQGYAEYIRDFLRENDLRVRYVNLAKAGQTSSQLLKRLKTDVQDQQEVKRADVICITIGGNDLLQHLMKGDSLFTVLQNFARIEDQYQENLRAILQSVKRQNPTAPIVLTSLYNPLSPTSPYYGEVKILIRNWNETMEDVARDFHQVTVVRLDDFRATGRLADGIHPNDAGYRFIASKCAKAMEAQKIMPPVHSLVANK